MNQQELYALLDKEGIIEWDGNYWGLTTKLDELKKKAELVDYVNALDDIHEGKPVTVKGWGGVGFSSAKDFAFVRLMSQLEQASKERTVAHEKLNAIKKWMTKFERIGLPTNAWNDLDKILNMNDLDIIRWNLYPEEYPRDPLFPSRKSEASM